VGIEAQWRKVSGALSDSPQMRALEKIDRLAAFEAHIKKLEEEEEQVRRSIR